MIETRGVPPRGSMMEIGLSSHQKNRRSGGIRYHHFLDRWIAFAEKLEIKIWNGWESKKSITQWSASFSWRVVSNILDSTMGIPEADVATIARHLLYGCNQTRRAMRTRIVVFETSMQVLWVSQMDMVSTAIVGFHELEFLGENEIATGWECHGTTFPLEGKMPLIIRLMNEVPRSMSTAKVGTMPN